MASMTKRTKIHGVGINDSDKEVRNRETGFFCPYYSRWAHMIKRCYSEKFKQSNKTYIGCYVCDEWLTFSNFKKWMIAQDWKGKHLDKDILKPGNKVYSPSTCRFVSPELNNLLCDSARIRGKYKKGVCYNKINKNFLSYITIKGKRINLGSYKSETDAYNAYKKAKKEEIYRHADASKDKKIKDGLYLHANLL